MIDSTLFPFGFCCALIIGGHEYSKYKDRKLNADKTAQNIHTVVTAVKKGLEEHDYMECKVRIFELLNRVPENRLQELEVFLLELEGEAYHERL